MKRLIAVLLAALLLSACGGGDTNEESEPATTIAAADASTTSALSESERNAADAEAYKKQMEDILGPTPADVNTKRAAPEIEKAFAESMGLDPANLVESARAACPNGEHWSCYFDSIQTSGKVELYVSLSTPDGWTDEDMDYLGCSAAVDILGSLGREYTYLMLGKASVNGVESRQVIRGRSIEEECVPPINERYKD